MLAAYQGHLERDRTYCQRSRHANTLSSSCTAHNMDRLLIQGCQRWLLVLVPPNLYRKLIDDGTDRNFKRQLWTLCTLWRDELHLAGHRAGLANPSESKKSFCPSPRYCQLWVRSSPCSPSHPCSYLSAKRPNPFRYSWPSEGLWQGGKPRAVIMKETDVKVVEKDCRGVFPTRSANVNVKKKKKKTS